MEHVIGVDVSKHRLEAYDLATGRRLEVANEARPGSPGWRARWW